MAGILPQSIYWGPRLASEVYGTKAVYITENGCVHDNEPLVNGEILDLHRRDFVRNYLKELRFGIVHTDYKILKRTPKLSANWYSQVMRENRIL